MLASLLLLLLLLCDPLMGLLTRSELGGLELFQMKLLTLGYELLSLIFEALAFAFHRCFQLLEVAQFYLELLHLSFDEKRHQGLNLALLDGCEMLRFHGCRREGSRRRRLQLGVSYHLIEHRLMVKSVCNTVGGDENFN